ncbi:hypothetical protein [Clostridium sp. 'White wine YQ']|uniref:hypothetical protein n=1 Tax=Clostridium sp. 'White wine YQ' TaxID=3027474 RepID=UPI0023665F25|nr:hypothetical protein [Clostridium sp. 'White wine YQ']MDD7795869.1 hypothetical protein [Clostridium sp. 'White wine YQ']
MKRNIKALLACAVLSLILQFIVLIWLDKFYLKENANVNVKEVSVNKPQEQPEKNVDLPNDMSTLQVSYNGKFLAYIKDSELKIINSSTGEEKSFTNENQDEISYFTWLPDRNIMLVSKKERTNKGKMFTLYNYDAEKNDAQKISDIAAAQTGSKINSIKASTITGVTYIEIKSSSNKASVYRMDINQTSSKKIDLQSSSLTGIFVVPREERLIYQDLNGKIYLTQPKASLTISHGIKTKVLGIDNDSTVYLGEVNNGKIVKVLYGSLNSKNTSQWESKELTTAADEKDIYITSSGKILINYSSSNTLLDLKENKKMNYEGTFISVYNKGITTSIDDKYHKTDFSKL